MTHAELASICAELHMLSPSTDVNVANASMHASVLRSIWRHVQMVRADVEPIIQTGVLFDADIVADAAALDSSTLTTIGGIVDLEPVMTPPGGPMIHLTDQLWEFMDLAERIWLTLFKRYRAAAAAVGPTIVADQEEGRAGVLARPEP